jgi:hypothetical protein
MEESLSSDGYTAVRTVMKLNEALGELADPDDGLDARGASGSGDR